MAFRFLSFHPGSPPKKKRVSECPTLTRPNRTLSLVELVKLTGGRRRLGRNWMRRTCVLTTSANVCVVGRPPAGWEEPLSLSSWLLLVYALNFSLFCILKSLISPDDFPAQFSRRRQMLRPQWKLLCTHTFSALLSSLLLIRYFLVLIFQASLLQRQMRRLRRRPS